MVEDDHLRHFESGQPRADVLTNGGFGQPSGWLSMDVGGESLAELRVGDAEHRHIAHAVELEQACLDLDGINVRAAGNDQVMRTIRKMKEPIRVQVSNVTDRDVAISIDLTPPIVLIEVREGRPVAGRPDIDLSGLSG